MIDFNKFNCNAYLLCIERIINKYGFVLVIYLTEITYFLDGRKINLMYKILFINLYV